MRGLEQEMYLVDPLQQCTCMSCNWFPTKVYCFHEGLITQFWLFALNISVSTDIEHQGNRYPATRNSASPPETFTQQLNTPGTVTILQGGLIEDNSSVFKLMAWRWTDARPFPEQYHFTYANLSPGLQCYHDKNSLCNQNNRCYKQLSQRQPSVAVTVTVFYTWQYRLSLPPWCANAIFINDTLRGYICYW